MNKRNLSDKEILDLLERGLDNFFDTCRETGMSSEDVGERARYCMDSYEGGAPCSATDKDWRRAKELSTQV